MNVEDRAKVIHDPEARAAMYERLTAAIEIAEISSKDAPTQWERQLWDHVITLCGEALCEIGELVEDYERPIGKPQPTTSN